MTDRVLVVDGDVSSLRVLEVSLRAAGFAVETATTGSEAWDKLQDDPSGLPDVVLADTELEGVDGFELCSRMRRTSGGTNVPFLLMAADQSLERKIRALEAGADDYLVKPAFVKEVLARIQARLHRRARDRLISGSLDGNATADSSAAFSGDLAEITVVDLLQLVEVKRRSGIIHLRGDAGTPAAIYARQGRVVDAEVGQLSGIDALSRLFAWTAGTFQVEWKSIRRKDAMERAPGAVIIEGLQQLDERNRLSATFSDPSAALEVNYGLLAERLAEIPDEMNSVLRLCDGVRTLTQILEDCPLSDVEALTALIRLRAEGIIFYRREHAPGKPGGEKSESAASALSAGPTETPQANAVPHRDNLIQFPGTSGGVDNTRPPEEDVLPSLLTDALPPHLQALQRNVPNQHPGFGEEDIGQPGIDTVSPSGLSDAAIPRSAGGTSHTQRGFGARIPSGSAPSDTAVPREVVDRGSSGTRETSVQYRTSDSTSDSTSDCTSDQHSSARDTGAAPAEQPPSKDGVPASLRSVEITPSLGAQTTDQAASPDGASSPMPTGGDRSGARRYSGKVMASGGVDATERMQHPDELTPSEDAQDDLGLPSRWRGARFLAVALAVGGLAAVVTHRLRSVSEADQSAGAPHQVGVANGSAHADTNAAHSPSTSGSPATPVAPAAAVGPMPMPTPMPMPMPTPTPTPPVDLPVPVPGPPTPAAGGESAGPATAIGPADNPTPSEPGSAAPGPPAGSSAAPRGAPVVVPVTAMPSVERQGPQPAQFLATCRTAFARNRQQEALSACAAALAANPRSAEALTMLAHAELNRGRLSRAGDLADKALALDPGSADAYVIAGAVHQDSGRNSEAKAAYRKYLELAPRGRYADELRSIVNSL